MDNGDPRGRLWRKAKMNSIDLTNLKSICPMPILLQKIGLGEYAKLSVRAPFREDKNPSWGIFEREGNWFFKDQATGDSGDEITLLGRWKNLDDKADFPELLRLYSEIAGTSKSYELTARKNFTPRQNFDWAKCVAEITSKQIEKFSQLRGYSLQFCQWLKAQNLIGIFENKLAFPVHDENGKAVSCHYRIQKQDGKVSWLYPKGSTSRPLVIGDLSTASCVWAFESQFDAFAVMDKLNWHNQPDEAVAIIITRGAANGNLVAGLCPAEVTVYAFKQNDEEKNGKRAGDEWLKSVSENAGCKVCEVITPLPYKDCNDWTKAGASGEEIFRAIKASKLVRVALCSAVENVENVENSYPCEDVSELFSTLSTLSTDVQPAIYPVNSALARYMEFASKREESADAYLLGAILPVLAAMLGRRVSLPWSEGRIYPNLYAILAGKPGDRKSSAINLAHKIAKATISGKHFLPDLMSVEAMFDEYDGSTDENGNPKKGCADKILIADDGNPFLGMLQKSNYGERVAQRLLTLYDCQGLQESFKRNEKTTGDARRIIEETSTSIVLGATFDIAQFKGHESRAGLQRRFLNYVAEKHGRFISYPGKNNPAELREITDRFARLAKLLDVEFILLPETRDLWSDFQLKNRKRLVETAGSGMNTKFIYHA